MSDHRLLSHKGFTLVEMAIVLVIVGLLVGLGSSMIGPLTNMAKSRETREIIDSDIASITSFAASNNRLPNATEFPTAVKRATDGWTHNLIYLYDNNLYSATPTKDTLCGRKTAAITITDNSVNISNVAFAVISKGEDAITQTTLNGTLNGAAINGVITGSGTATGTITLDATASDIIRWVTLDELRSKIGCQGAQLKILNNELPPATVAALYPNATAGATLAIATDGGATPGIFRWCVQAPSAVPLPAGLGFNPLLAGAIRVAPNTCNAANPLAEASWILSPTLTISGTPAAGSQGAYNFTLFVRDNNDAAAGNDNIASKAFVLTVNP